MNRRFFLWSGAAALGTSRARSKPANNETVYRFAAGDCDVSMAVEFFDNYSSNGFYFRDLMAQRRFCLSRAGEENRSCSPNFIGSIAIARYHVHCHSREPVRLALIERVRTIDQGNRLRNRAPFERRIELTDGVASDIQAFGYQADEASTLGDSAASDPPWYLLRQDLYLEGADILFLVIHWKHTLGAIRLLDVIPAGRTRVVAEPGGSNRRIR
jgi:hypothetical protein